MLVFALLTLQGGCIFSSKTQVKKSTPEAETEAVQPVPEEIPAPADLPPGLDSPYQGSPSMILDVAALYREARGKLLKKNYEGAADLFQRIARDAPQASLAPNAVYWLAECYYSRRYMREAIAEFERLTRLYPMSPKAPDAYLKLAYSYSILGDGNTAMIYVRNLLDRYPSSRAAGMVRNRKTKFPAK